MTEEIRESDKTDKVGHGKTRKKNHIVYCPIII
jgi:hypothetical protein